ncbi:MAG: radical SAM protein, partial [Deltaproteobacteria bacterium]|nr:radical SAM protein [Deltaproteobacteria bacterium]
MERGSVESPMFQRLRHALPDVPFEICEDGATVNGHSRLVKDYFGAAKKRLFVATHKGEFLKKCPGSDGQVCCNYYVINFASNCSMDCCYCYLQEYLSDNPALKVFSNTGDLLGEV